jgi:hypothetical protein
VPYYYACSYPLASGSVIKKGNWGRICKMESIFQNTHLLKEVIFENVRQQKYLERPSRFECIFLCPNVDSLRNFVNTQRPYDLLYEVELIENNPEMFETDWNLLSPNNVTIVAVEEAAHKYWAPQNVRDDQKEILVESDIRIIRQLPLRDT